MPEAPAGNATLEMELSWWRDRTTHYGFHPDPATDVTTKVFIKNLFNHLMIIGLHVSTSKQYTALIAKFIKEGTEDYYGIPEGHKLTDKSTRDLFAASPLNKAKSGYPTVAINQLRLCYQQVATLHHRHRRGALRRANNRPAPMRLAGRPHHQHRQQYFGRLLR